MQAFSDCFLRGSSILRYCDLLTKVYLLISNVRFIKTGTKYSSVLLLRFVPVFLRQTLLRIEDFGTNPYFLGTTGIELGVECLYGI